MHSSTTFLKLGKVVKDEATAVSTCNKLVSKSSFFHGASFPASQGPAAAAAADVKPFTALFGDAFSSMATLAVSNGAFMFIATCK